MELRICGPVYANFFHFQLDETVTYNSQGARQLIVPYLALFNSRQRRHTAVQYISLDNFILQSCLM